MARRDSFVSLLFKRIRTPEVISSILEDSGLLDDIEPRNKKKRRDYISVERKIFDAEGHYCKTVLLVSRERLMDLVRKVGPLIKVKNSGQTNQLWRQVAITLLYLRGDSVRVISDAYGVNGQTCRNYIRNVINAVNELQLVTLPNDWEAVKRDFAIRGPFDRVIGCIDGTIIKCGHPKKQGCARAAHCVRKNCAGLNVLAICDRSTRIWWMSTLGLGSAHDSALFRQVDGYAWIHSLKGVTGDGYLLGDAGFQNCDVLLTPYRSPDSPDEYRFNTTHSRSRICIERAFGVIKARWRILDRRVDISWKNIPAYISACFALHNFFLSGTDVDQLYERYMEEHQGEKEDEEEEDEEEEDEEDEEEEDEDYVYEPGEYCEQDSKRIGNDMRNMIRDNLRRH